MCNSVIQKKYICTCIVLYLCIHIRGHNSTKNKTKLHILLHLWINLNHTYIRTYSFLYIYIYTHTNTCGINAMQRSPQFRCKKLVSILTTRDYKNAHLMRRYTFNSCHLHSASALAWCVTIYSTTRDASHSHSDDTLCRWTSPTSHVHKCELRLQCTSDPSRLYWVTACLVKMAFASTPCYKRCGQKNHTLS